MYPQSYDESKDICSPHFKCSANKSSSKTGIRPAQSDLQTIERLYETSFKFKEDLLRLKAEYEDVKENSLVYDGTVQELSTLMREFETEQKKLKKQNKLEMTELCKSTNELAELDATPKTPKDVSIMLKQVRFPTNV